MNQHSIQEAYLKLFCINGKLWAHDKNTRTALHKPAKWCTSEDDFQSEYLEKIQNDTIESPGIKAIKEILIRGKITQEEYELVRYWTALHLIRTQKFREHLNVDYINNYEEMIEKEKAISFYFKHFYVFNCPIEKYFITSDNPIIEFKIENSIARVFPLSPTKLLLLSPYEDTISHTELEFTELINSIL